MQSSVSMTTKSRPTTTLQIVGVLTGLAFAILMIWANGGHHLQ